METKEETKKKMIQEKMVHCSNKQSLCDIFERVHEEGSLKTTKAIRAFYWSEFKVKKKNE